MYEPHPERVCGTDGTPVVRGQDPRCPRSDLARVSAIWGQIGLEIVISLDLPHFVWTPSPKSIKLPK